LIVGGEDREVLALNASARKAMRCKTSLKVIPGAGHLFEEEGALDQALAAAVEWYESHLRGKRSFFHEKGDPPILTPG
jgi:alpha-beta hydrolase superfamily lysophospholipase